MTAFTNPHVVTIVVNWRLKMETIACIETLQALDYPTEIIVVDNASGDDSAATIRQCFPQVTVIENETNRGFGQACNDALAFAQCHFDCDFVFLVNNDVTLAPDCLSHLLLAAADNENAAVLGAKVYYNDGSRRLWHAGARRRKGVLAATDHGRNSLDNGQYDKRHQVDYIFGAAMLIRRTIIDQIGFFDEHFFLYLEDLDFCLRAQQAGYELLFVAKAHAWHEGSASTKMNVGFRRYHMARSSMIFLRKHTRRRAALFIFFFWVMVYLRDILVDVARHDWHIARDTYRGLAAGATGRAGKKYLHGRE